MCSQVKCRSCGKVTWSGCGQHVNEVMRGVPASQRCQGHKAEPKPKKAGFFARLFGRGM